MSIITSRQNSLNSAVDGQERKGDLGSLEPVLEVNDETSEIFDRPTEDFDFEEISPRLFNKKTVLDACTLEGLNNAIYELGVVNLCWPEITEPVFETRICFPISYYTNNKKERLLLAYAENFRRQYHFHYKLRLPLLLQAPNECGLQKMVCTTVRPTKLTFADTNTWKGVASLVCDYFDYEPLSKPMLHPERLMSPYTAIIRRSANPFELAHICVSWLIGANYDAYVAVGAADRDTCMAIRYRTTCPEIPDETEVIDEEPPPEEEPRYRLVPLPDLTSKFLQKMLDREEAEKQEELDKIEAEKQKKISELEAPPPDPIDGWRIHAWVIVMPGSMGVVKPFFIEPSEGLGYPLDSIKYKRLDSLYNHENYYVNLQKCVEEKEQKDKKKDGKKEQNEEEELEQKVEEEQKEQKVEEEQKEENEEEKQKEDTESETSTCLAKLNFDLTNLSCWEHLLAGEPFHRRNLAGVDYNDNTTAVDTDKHLDMPASWVEKLEVTADEKARRYPGSHKQIHYKKVLLDKFAPYSERDGIVKRIRIFDDYAMTKILTMYEYFENRVDYMYSIKVDYVEGICIEKFHTGRRDHLIKHTYDLDSAPLSLEVNRTMEFNYYARLDHLTKVVCTDLTFSEDFTDREDNLESSVTVYSVGTKLDPSRQLRTIIQTYRRDPKKPAKLDVWKRIFNVQDNSIDLLYHYAYNFVTNDTRQYIKPNLAGTGGKILFYPDKTSAYISDPNGTDPRPLDVYLGLCENMAWEQRLTKHIRDSKTDISDYLRQRHREFTEPLLYVDLFTTERNEAAKKGWKEQELAKAEMSEREKEAEIDPLAPYLARMFGSGHGTGQPLSYKEAFLVREQCINDYKSKQLMRQNLVMDRFEKLNEEYKAKKLWYLANQFILKPAQESAYFAASAKMAFDVHTFEVRLTRSKDLSGPRFKALEDYLDRHPLLKELKRKQYRKKELSDY